MTPLAVRLRAAFLSGLFLLGAVGIALADAALFHEAGHDPYAGVTHVEPLGATHHGDRCTLGVPQAPSHTAPQVDGSVIATRGPESPVRPRPATTPRSTDFSALPRSRAPPHTA